MIQTIKRVLSKSGFCLDSVRLLDCIMSRSWLRVLAFRLLRMRFSPAILDDALKQDKGLLEKSRLFSLGMSFLNIGVTYKTTGANRTVLADQEILNLARGSRQPRLLEVGVSDGSATLSLLESDASFSEVVLTDRFNCFYEKPIAFGKLYLDSDERVLGIKFLCFYLNLSLEKKMDSSGMRRIETVSPLLQKEYGIESIRRFNMLKDVLSSPVDIIKCSNILNKVYFTDSELRRAVSNLASSLKDNGYIVISHNNEKYEKGEAFFTLQKRFDVLDIVTSQGSHELESCFAQGVSLDPSYERKLRIYLLAPSLEVGGAERQLVALANGLASRGHEVRVGLHYPGGALESDLEGVAVDYMNKSGRWDFGRFVYRLYSSITGFQPDVVYSFLGTPNILTALMKPLLTPARIIWSIRASDVDPSAYGNVAAFADRVETCLARFADFVVVNSSAGFQHVVQKGFPSESLKLIPNGFNLQEFFPDRSLGKTLRKAWNVSDGDILIGLVARLDPAKDHRTFLRAAALAMIRHKSLRFVCVGSGPLESKLQSFSNALGLDDRIVWAGAQKDMHAAYNAFDICCLSSVTEGFPNVLGEAMACGVPCVATDAGDSAMIVGDAGIITPVGDEKALAQALLQMVSRIEQGTIADTRSRIDKLFSTDAMINATEKLLKEVA